jgi:hypothetical protein
MAGIDSFENKVTYIVVSGVKMTKKEYQKYKKEKDAEEAARISENLMEDNSGVESATNPLYSDAPQDDGVPF